jgi:chromosome segregation ATPase
MTPDEFDCFLDSLVYDREEFKSALEQAGVILALKTETNADREARHSHRERADRLEAKVERLKLQWTAMKSEVQLCHRKIEAAEAKNARLREVLEHLVEADENRNQFRGNLALRAAWDEVRAALKET